MLKRTNNIAIFLFALLLSECKTPMIPSGYRFTPREMKNEITGCWININNRTTDTLNSFQALSGELISLENDTLYVLTPEQLTGIPYQKVNNAVLYIFMNRAGIFAKVTSLVYIPDIIAAIGYKLAPFLLVGIPMVITGAIISGGESGNKTNLLLYPERDKLSGFRDFARFPRGIPKEVDRSKLHLFIDRKVFSN
jgi:hypothetical protein